MGEEMHYKDVSELSEALGRAGDARELAGLTRGVRAFVAGRAESGDVLDTGRAAAALYDGLLARAAVLARDRPPGGFCLAALGSQARGEQFLATDQDNALILPDPADAPEAREAWTAFAARLRDVLAAAGLPPCPKGIMAATPEWRRTLREWREALDAAADRPDAGGVLLVSLLADVRAVWGDPALAEALAGQVRRHAADAPLLVRGLAREALRFAPESGFPGPFSGFGKNHTSLDLKRAAVYPLALGVKALALEAGLTETGTVERLDGLVRRGLVGGELGARLTRAFACVQGLRLRAQARALAAGRAPDNLIERDALPVTDREALRQALHAVAELAAVLEHHFGLAYLT
ncbi:putative nucleotidyltransferase substrate binding domain-containing protein [Solidesulfovibrio sp.]|uniref:putative nucleotidyltransferase substrate binding domain-containing protein n=1 Tax=Solidesulfovibrio sp. TaxID=2910990 RepID=UPI00262B8582|nr:putative nucleotidyltransferase substrate binding domain-containing protein [Solidesulfovibrio sp.]